MGQRYCQKIEGVADVEVFFCSEARRAAVNRTDQLENLFSRIANERVSGDEVKQELSDLLSAAAGAYQRAKLRKALEWADI
jgi:hypothetical protein